MDARADLHFDSDYHSVSIGYANRDNDCYTNSHLDAHANSHGYADCHTCTDGYAYFT